MLKYVPPSQYTILANPPSFQSVTRDVYKEEEKFSYSFIKILLLGICSICRHLHSKGISHGDLYGHNILVSRGTPADTGDVGGGMLPPLLGDMGAASFYTVSTPTDIGVDGVCGSDRDVPIVGTEKGAGTHSIQLIEVRAFGCLIKELLDRCNVSDLSCAVLNGDEQVDRTTLYEKLRVLQGKCLDKILVNRPSFDEIYKELNSIL